MDEPEALQVLLNRTVQGLDLGEPPSAGYFSSRRQRRRRTRWGVLSAAGTVVVVVAAVSLVSHLGGGRHLASPPSPHPTGRGASVEATARALASAAWSQLPAAPITGRSGGVGVWTGRQMIVWGGAADNKLKRDGASYDPATRTWVMLPISPLSARTAMATVLAGDSLFIWGGSDQSKAGRALDGAVYDTATRKWTTLPTAPVTDYSWAQAFWTGSRVILLSTPTGNDIGAVHAAAYDLDARRWSPLPDLALPSGHTAVSVSALAAAETLYVWSHWSHSTKINASSTDIQSGIDGFTLDATTQRWSANSLVPDQHKAVTNPLWTGHDIVLPASDIWCGVCSHPRGTNLSGYLIHPDGGRIESIAHGRVDDLRPMYLWTGAALLAFNTGTYTTGPGQTHFPGEAAAWDPATGTWISLPNAPLAGNDVVAAWTGKSLIMWGQMFTAKQANGSGPVHSHTAGLQLSNT
jgi:hypothetical protein